MALASIMGVTNPAGILGAVGVGKIFGQDAPGGALGALATLSAFDQGPGVTLSGGDLTYSTSVAYAGVFSSAYYTSGKREYWIYNDMGNRQMAGFATWQTALGNYPGVDANAITVWADNGRIYNGGGTAQFLAGSIPDQTWLGVRHDPATGEVWFKREADGGWTLASVTLPTGEVYAAIVGTGTAGAADTSTVAFDPSSFPEAIGAGFSPVREPVLDTYTPGVLHGARVDADTRLGPDGNHWGWTAAKTFALFSRFSETSGKFEFWTRRGATGTASDHAMSGFGSSSHPSDASNYPGESIYGAAFYYADGTMWAGASKTGNPTLGAVANDGYVGHRIDIGAELVEFTVDLGSNWETQVNVDSAMWSDGAISPLVGVSSGVSIGYDLDDYNEAIFDPSNFPVAISAGYSAFSA